MNRILKKAVSFISAVAMSASVLMTMPVTASAASSSVKATQTVANNYEYCVTMDSGVFFASGVKKESDSFKATSKSSIVMLTSAGKKVSVKNTIGFDKVYANVTTSTNQTWNRTDFLTLGKGKKYAALLTTGKYLAGGKLFDEITDGGMYSKGYIVATSGKTKYYYSLDGKQLGKSSADADSEYDKETNTLLIKDPSTVNGKTQYSCSIVNNGKTVKTFKTDSNAYFTTEGSTAYIRAYPLDKKSGVYYTVKGKETEVKKSSSSSYDENLSVSYQFNDDRTKKTVTVTDKKGKTVLSYTNKSTRDPSYITVNGKLVIADGRLYILDDKTGKVKVKTADKGLTNIFYSSETGSSFIVYSIVDKSDFNFDYVYSLYSSAGKLLIGDCDYISPITDVYAGYYFYTYSKTSSFIVTKNGKTGIIDSKGKTVVKPSSSYTSGYALSDNISVMRLSNGKNALIDNKTGKKLKTVDYIGVSNPLSDKVRYVVTADKTGKKYGCMVVKG